MFEKISECRWNFHHKEWDKVSSDAKDLLSSLLIKDANKRVSAAEAIEHPWFKIDPELDDVEIDVNVLKQLSDFDCESKLKKAAMNALV